VQSAHAAANSVGTWGVLRGSEVGESTVDHSPPPSARLKKEWIHAFNPSYTFMKRIQTTLLKKILRRVFRQSSYCQKREREREREKEIVCVCVNTHT
jgi:hypothetical protein